MTEEQKDFLDMLEPLNIEARYPVDKAALLKAMTYEKCQGILDKTEELHQWNKKKLLRS
jgi:hypothetical protein